jgi:hypothetical protein
VTLLTWVPSAKRRTEHKSGVADVKHTAGDNRTGLDTTGCPLGDGMNQPEGQETPPTARRRYLKKVPSALDPLHATHAVLMFAKYPTDHGRYAIYTLPTRTHARLTENNLAAF